MFLVARFGHSMMPKNVPMMSKDGEERDVELHHVFNNVSMFRTEPDTVDQIVRGQTRTPAAAWDPVFNNDLNNKLFHEELDLVALNINRGRDHGLPGYNTYRGICTSQGYQRAQSWEDLNFQPEVGSSQCTVEEQGVILTSFFHTTTHTTHQTLGIECLLMTGS